MSSYLIKGGVPLKGTLTISGNKNSILPCLAAAILTKSQVTIHNVPKILDVTVFIGILEFLGAKVDYQDSTIKISCQKLTNKVIPREYYSKLRASILLVGPQLARFGKVEFYHPGGDVIGRRGIELHLEGFKQLGFKVIQDDHHYKVKKSKVTSDCEIFFGLIATVTGTENIILASVLRPGKTTIRNAASEPHVVDLCNLLNLMGAKISGIGSNQLEITGVKSLIGADFSIGPDLIELGTYIVAAAITKGSVEFQNCQTADLEPIIWPLKKMGVNFEIKADSIQVSAKKLAAIPRLLTNVWPGFPTDMMSALIVLATQAEGISLLHDWIYESRMFFVDKLISMGADITIADPHRVIVSGPTTLRGRNLETPDIRAGMALVLASLVAQGESTINRAELIERGYQDVVEKLAALGANIHRIE